MDTKRKLTLAVGGCVAVVVALAVVWTIRRNQSGAGLLAGGRQVSAFSKQPFSANMTISTQTANVHDVHPGKSPSSTAATPLTYHGKMYAGPAALRTDIEMKPQGTASVIVRYDKGVAWILTPNRHYIETPIEERTDLLSALRDTNAKIQKQDLGPEQVGAYPCEKYHVQVTEKGQPESGWIWVAKSKDLNGFIVKVEDEASKETVVFSEIHLAAPQSAVFDIPPGYQKLTKSQALPGDDDD